jgi:hypothetical protein
MEGERVVFTEESNPQSYLKLIASGDVDETMLKALEDYVKRQKKRLGLPEKRGRQLRQPTHGVAVLRPCLPLRPRLERHHLSTEARQNLADTREYGSVPLRGPFPRVSRTRHEHVERRSLYRKCDRRRESWTASGYLLRS